MALNKQHREEIRKIQARQSRKFFRTGVPVKGSLKGTDNTARPTGVKRETTVPHVTVGGAVVQLNANAKSKIVPKLGMVVDKSNLRLVAKSITLSIGIKSEAGTPVADVSVSQPVKECDLYKASGKLFADLVDKLDEVHDDAMEALDSSLAKHNYNSFDDTIIKRNGFVYTVNWDVQV